MTRRATAAHLRSDLGAIRAFTDRLLAPLQGKPDSPAVIDELVRRNEHPAADGYPSSSLGGSRSGEVGRPTERAALSPPPIDISGRYLDAVTDLIEDMAREARRGEGLRQRILDIGEEERGRTNSVPNCVNPHCGRSLVGQGPNDRGIANYCNNCYHWRHEHQGMLRPPKLIDAERRRDAEAS